MLIIKPVVFVANLAEPDKSPNYSMLSLIMVFDKLYFCCTMAINQHTFMCGHYTLEMEINGEQNNDLLYTIALCLFIVTSYTGWSLLAVM